MRSKVVNIITNFIHNGRIYGNRTQYQANQQFIDLYNKSKLFLNKNKDIVITSTDKGKKTVALNKKDYMEKMVNLLNDVSIYKIIKNDPTFTLMNKNNALIRQLKTENYIDEKTKFQLSNNNSICPKIYGLPKTHKDGNPLRPVVSNKDSACYGLARFCGNIIGKIINKEIYNITNSFEFKNFIEAVNVPENYMMISFDVTSLFTNVSIDNVINVIEKRWDEIAIITPIPKEKFINLIKFCLVDCNYFMYDGQIYRQIFGTAMGNPLSPIVAGLVLDDLLEEKLKLLPFKSIFFKKYVDDCITVIPPNEIDNVLNILNSYDPKLKFTYELETNGQLNFLDMSLIKQPSGKIITNWYKKSITSDRILNFYSHHAFKYKRNTAYNLIYRILELSNEVYHPENREKIKMILKSNQYPKYLIEEMMREYYGKKRSTIPRIKITNTDTKYQSLIYVNELSERIAKTLQKEFKDTTIAFKNNKTIRDLFTKTKDPLKKELKSNVCYKIPCLNCEKVYIGQTSRHLKTRLAEHRRDTTPKKKTVNRLMVNTSPRLTPNKTALKYHHESKGHNFNFENVEIVGKEKHLGKRLVMEACNVIIRPNACNNRADSENIEMTYAALLKNFYNI